MDTVFEWGKPDWNGIEKTTQCHGLSYIGEQDVYQFVADAFASAERQTGISMEEFCLENLDFLEEVERFFSENRYVSEKNYRFEGIKELLRVPIKV